MKEKPITRRDFLRAAAGATMTATLGGASPGEARVGPAAKVVLIRNAEALGSQGNVQGEILQSMLDEAVKTLLGAKEPLEGWRKLIRSSDIVGIKSNSWYRLPTPKELVSFKSGVIRVFQPSRWR